MRVLLKQGQIKLDKKGNYQRKDFNWEKNLTQMGLCKKREKTFIFSDDDVLDEYTKQLESQLEEYNTLKKIFKNYYVVGNETMYDGCIKMQDEIDQLKEENKLLVQQKFREVANKNDYIKEMYIEKSKIKEILYKKERETDEKALDWDAMKVLEELEIELLGEKI